MKQDIILKNGLRLIAHQNQNIHTVDLSLFFRAGSIYENKNNKGISHLAEHLFFRNLNGARQKDLYFSMERLGTTLRASTYKECVCFYMTLMPDVMDEAIKIISQILIDFTWDKDSIDKEKEVVKCEIEYKNQWNQTGPDSRYFKDSPYHAGILGSCKTIDRLSTNEINAWKKTYFNCSNACFLVSGNFTEDRLNYIINNIEQIENPGKPAVIPSFKPIKFCHRDNSSNIVAKTENNLSDVWIAFDVKLNQNRYYYALFLSSILGEGVGSRLSALIREKHGLTYEIYSSVDYYVDFARIRIEFSVQSKSLKKSLKLLFGELKRFKKNITEQDFSACIRFFTENRKQEVDDPRSLNDIYGWNFFIYGGDSQLIEEDIYRNMTIEELLREANIIFSNKNMTIDIENNSHIYSNKKLKRLCAKLREDL